MDKQQAAEFLGISTRMLERYEAQGRISVKTVKAGRTRKNLYDADELATLKTELEAATVKPRVERSETSRHEPTKPADTPPTGRTATGRTGPKPVALVKMPTGDEVLPALANALTDIGNALKSRHSESASVSELAFKLWLTIDEAVQYSGIPRSILVRLVKDGKIKSAGRLRTLRIHRESLEGFDGTW